MNRRAARRDQLGGVGVPQGVGRSPHIKPRLFPIHCHQLLDRPNREMPAQLILEQRPIRRDTEPDLLVEGQKLHDTDLSHFVERDNPAARVFADRRRKVQWLASTIFSLGRQLEVPTLAKHGSRRRYQLASRRDSWPVRFGNWAL